MGPLGPEAGEKDPGGRHEASAELAPLSGEWTDGRMDRSGGCWLLFALDLSECWVCMAGFSKWGTSFWMGFRGKPDPAFPQGQALSHRVRLACLFAPFKPKPFARFHSNNFPTTANYFLGEPIISNSRLVRADWSVTSWFNRPGDPQHVTIARTRIQRERERERDLLGFLARPFTHSCRSVMELISRPPYPP